MSRSPLTQRFKAAFWILLSIAVLGIVAVGALYWLPASVDYTVTERYSFATTEDAALVYLGVLLPKSGPYQTVLVSEINWDGRVRREYTRYIDVVKFDGRMSDSSTQEAIVEFTIRLRQGKIVWEMPVDDFQTAPQYNIESDDPLIVDQATLITSGDPVADVRSIFKFTSDYLCPGGSYRHFRDSSALKALMTGAGSCGESANLMVALCRASSIPSQTIIGILFPDALPYAAAQTSVDKYPADSHAWVEYRTEQGWAMADPGCRTSILNRLLFGRSDGRHLSYGEAEQLGDRYAAVHLWALRNGRLISADFESLKYIASSDQDSVSMTPSVTVKKGWDGRWVNLAIAWLAATVILYRLNRKQVRKLYPPTPMDFAYA